MAHLIDNQKVLMRNTLENALKAYHECEGIDVSAGIAILRYATNGLIESSTIEGQTLLLSHYYGNSKITHAGLKILRAVQKDYAQFKFKEV